MTAAEVLFLLDPVALLPLAVLAGGAVWLVRRCLGWTDPDKGAPQ